MEEILYLVHRIPYPPDKGDKIRSFNILRELATRYKVHLGCFIDDPADWQHSEVLQQLCETTCILDRPRLTALAKAPIALASNEPLTLCWYQSRRMRHWVDTLLTTKSIHQVLAFSSSMGPYLRPAVEKEIPCILDMVDVDSAKWHQYADKHKGLHHWIYRREGRLLAKYEERIAENCAAVTLVSTPEAELLRSRLPNTYKQRIQAVCNGVDSVFFNPATVETKQPAPSARTLVFTGAMDYWANAEAIIWFCNAIWPVLKQRHPDLRLQIVGARPTASVKALGQHADVEVTGRVADVRPYLFHAHFIIAPLQIARGIQNKVLEAMSMAKPVIATSMALEGIGLHSGLAVVSANTEAEFIQRCLDWIALDTLAAPQNRLWIESHFSWKAQLSPLMNLLEAV